MGRPAQDAETLRLHGNFRADRHKNRGVRPRFAGEPRPMSLLCPDAAAVWSELVPPLIKSGLVCELDSAMLSMLCDMVSLYRIAIRQQLELGPATQPGRRAGASAATAATFIKDLASRYGLDRQSREKLLVAPDTETPDDIERRFFGGVPTRRRDDPLRAKFHGTADSVTADEPNL
jgi:phage terminase small subunit